MYARMREISMIDVSKIPHDRVGLGSTVTVLDEASLKAVADRYVMQRAEQISDPSRPRSCRKSIAAS